MANNRLVDQDYADVLAEFVNKNYINGKYFTFEDAKKCCEHYCVDILGKLDQDDIEMIEYSLNKNLKSLERTNIIKKINKEYKVLNPFTGDKFIMSFPEDDNKPLISPNIYKMFFGRYRSAETQETDKDL